MTTLLGLQACGLPAGSTSDQENDDIGGSTDEEDEFAPAQTISVRVERINGEIDQVNTSQISLISFDEDFEEVRDGSIPFYLVEKSDLDNYDINYEIKLDEVYVEQLHHAIKIRFNGDETLYASLYGLDSESEAITVNAKSHYVLKKLFDTIDSEDELQQMLPCSSSIANCLNQFEAKAAMLKQISEAAQGYEVQIASDATVSQAISTMEERLDFKEHIEVAVNEITRDSAFNVDSNTTSPIAKGVRRDFPINAGDILSKLNVAKEYNSLLFGLALNNLKPTDGQNEVSIATFNSTIVDNSASTDQLPIYPTLNQTTFLYDMRRDNLISSIPFERTQLSISESNAFDLDRDEPVNTLTTPLASSFLSTEGNLLDTRNYSQVVDESNSGAKIGWQFESLLNKVYQVNEAETNSSLASSDTEEIDYGLAPTWLVSSNFHTGSRYSVTGDSPDFIRGTQLDTMNIFSWEVHGLETDSDFTINDILGKEYGVISYALKMNESSKVLELFAETLRWDIPSRNFSITQPSTNNHYTSYTLDRSEDNTVSGINEKSNIINTSRTISTLKTTESSQTNPNGLASNQGLIQFDGSTGEPLGHSTQNGKYLAFVFNTAEVSDIQDRGTGILLATELNTSDNPRFSDEGERYQLQGNSFGMTSEKNILQNLTGSSLLISDRVDGEDISIDCHANLNAQRIFIEHTVGITENTLSDPEKQVESIPVSSQTCRLDGSEVEMSFENVFGQDLTLKGFITQNSNETGSNANGNLMTLIWKQGDNLGLIFANKEQALSPEFDAE